MTDEISVDFPNSRFSALRLPRDARPCDYLTVENSPVLFGCRTGICGTCLVHVEAEGKLAEPTAEERELLGIICPEDPNARLACQMKLTSDTQVQAIKQVKHAY